MSQLKMNWIYRDPPGSHKLFLHVHAFFSLIWWLNLTFFTLTTQETQMVEFFGPPKPWHTLMRYHENTTWKYLNKHPSINRIQSAYVSSCGQNLCLWAKSIHLPSGSGVLEYLWVRWCSHSNDHLYKVATLTSYISWFMTPSYVYIYIYICIYVYMYIRIYVYMYMYICISISISIRICICIII